MYEYWQLYYSVMYMSKIVFALQDISTVHVASRVVAPACIPVSQSVANDYFLQSL